MGRDEKRSSSKTVPEHHGEHHGQLPFSSYPTITLPHTPFPHSPLVTPCESSHLTAPLFRHPQGAREATRREAGEHATLEHIAEYTEYMRG